MKVEVVFIRIGELLLAYLDIGSAIKVIGHLLKSSVVFNKGRSKESIRVRHCRRFCGGGCRSLNRLYDIVTLRSVARRCSRLNFTRLCYSGEKF